MPIKTYSRRGSGEALLILRTDPEASTTNIKETEMHKVTRRSALGRTLAALAATPLLAQQAMAQTLGAGVKVVKLGKRASMLPGYKAVSMRDVILQPGAITPPNNVMKNDMVCHCLEGEMHVQKSGGAFNVKKGDVWSCTKGETERVRNTGADVAIMRIIDLLPA